MNNYLTRKIKVLSFLSILAVVWIHAFNSQPRYLQPGSWMEEGWNISSFIQFFISNGAARFAVPLFFLISGYLLFRTYDGTLQVYLRKLMDRVRTLLVPYLIWNTLGILVILGFLLVPWTQLTVAPWMAEMTWDQYLIGYLISPAAYQLWYLRDLFLFILMAPLWFFLLNNKWLGRGLLAISLVLAATNLSLSIFNTTGLFFFLWGCRVGLTPGRVDRRISRHAWEILTALWIFLLILRVAFSAQEAVVSGLLYFPIEILGVGVFWYGYDHLTRKSQDVRPFKLGETTMIIFLGHVPLLPLWTDFFLSMTKNQVGDQLLLYFLLPAGIILSLIALDRTMNRFFPGLRSLLTGGR